MRVIAESADVWMWLLLQEIFTRLLYKNMSTKA